MQGLLVLCPTYLNVIVVLKYMSLPLFKQKLDLEKETIDLVHTHATEIADLPRRIPQDSARYHFFLYKHSHEGDYLESVGKDWANLGRLHFGSLKKQKEQAGTFLCPLQIWGWILWTMNESLKQASPLVAPKMLLLKVGEALGDTVRCNSGICRLRLNQWKSHTHPYKQSCKWNKWQQECVEGVSTNCIHTNCILCYRGSTCL